MRSVCLYRKSLLLALVALVASPAHAVQYEWNVGDDSVKTTLNTSIQAGAQMRVEKRADDLISKTALNPHLCPVAANGAGTSCQGHTVAANPLHGPGGLNLNSYPGEGPASDEVFVKAPGAFSNNGDDGDLNYNRGDITQAVGKISEDLTMTYKNYGLFVRGLYFYDAENKDRENFNPNIQTIATTSGPGQIRRGIGEAAYHANNTCTFGTCNRKVENDDMGTAFQLLDANISGNFPFFGGRQLTVKLGRQPINWGESTTLIVNSLNTFDPPNVNNLFRPAFLDLAEVLTPIGALSVATNITDSVSVEAFYQYDWHEAEIPPPGSFMSTVDAGSHNARDYLNLGFGKGAEDPDHLGLPDQIILSAVADANEAFQLLPENKARNSGQYGMTLKYYADWLNNGTELGIYAANYHSRLPYVSFYEGQYGCFSNPNSPTYAPPTNIGAVDTALFALNCPGADTVLAVESALPVGVAPPVRDQNVGSNSGLLPGELITADTIKARLEYPEDIKLYGLSFNTSFGDISAQGEVAYRPRAPLQVDDTDLAFAALQNTFPRGNGKGDDTDLYSVSVPGVGEIAALPGARYGIPDFISHYRGIDPLSYAPGQYIRGWEYFRTAQYNLGATYIFGPGNWLKANQIITFGELGATQVFNLPGTDVLQIEGPGTNTHASAGTDGTGADGSKQSNSAVIGPTGLRFNPTQQKDGFATAFSWGYRIIAIIRYDNVFPGISFEPTVILGQDVRGTAPGPGENFVEGRKTAVINVEMRFAQGWSSSLGYAAFWGAGDHNLLSDRDFIQAGIRYRF